MRGVHKKKEWKAPDPKTHMLSASKCEGEAKNAMDMGWKSYNYEVGGQGSYDSGEIPDKMISCNDECFWNCSSSMSIDEGRAALCSILRRSHSICP